ncbi:hypothetical protein R6Q59_013154 [Mikania micrantha]
MSVKQKTTLANNHVAIAVAGAVAGAAVVVLVVVNYGQMIRLTLIGSCWTEFELGPEMGQEGRRSRQLARGGDLRQSTRGAAGASSYCNREEMGGKWEMRELSVPKGVAANANKTSTVGLTLFLMAGCVVGRICATIAGNDGVAAIEGFSCSAC